MANQRHSNFKYQLANIPQSEIEVHAGGDKMEMTDSFKDLHDRLDTSRVQDTTVPEHYSVNNPNPHSEPPNERDAESSDKSRDGCYCMYLCTPLEKKLIGHKHGDNENTSSSLWTKTTLKDHFLTTKDSNKKKIRRLWVKGLVHLSSVILLTVQLIFFVHSKLVLTDFLHANKLTFSQLFVMGPVSSDQDYTRPIPSPIRVIFTQDELFEQLNYTATQFFNLNELVGQYGYKWNIGGDPVPPQLSLKVVRRMHGVVDPTTKTYNVSLKTVTDFYNVTNTSDPINDALNWSSVIERLSSVMNIQVKLIVSSIYIQVTNSDEITTSCFEFDIKLNINNYLERGNGMQVDMDVDARMSSCNNNNTGDSLDLVVFQDQKAIAVDCLVITISTIYILLCFRSLINSWYMTVIAWKFFNKHLKLELTWRYFIPLFNLWFMGVIVVSFAAIIMSSLKLGTYDDPNSIAVVYINYIPVILGLVVFLQWCGILRFLSYSESFNTLLVTVEKAMPSVLRFCVCGFLLFVSYVLLGWLVLGAYHPKFRDVFTTSESLFSLLNGDDMFETFKGMSQESTGAWIFSKIYLYTFICLFIFVILSLFIALISNTYDTIRDKKKGNKHASKGLLKDFASGNLEQVPNNSDGSKWYYSMQILCYAGMSEDKYKRMLNAIDSNEKSGGRVNTVENT